MKAPHAASPADRRAADAGTGSQRGGMARRIYAALAALLFSAGLLMLGALPPAQATASAQARATSTWPSLLPTPTPRPATRTPVSRPAAPAPPAATAAPRPAAAAGALIIDHTSIEAFDRIPDAYIAKAAALRLLHRHASVGQNISEGLDCLMNYFPDRPRRPNYCDRGIPADQIFFDPKYDRTNWVYELHAPLPNPNPIWPNKVIFFADRVNQAAPGEFDVVSMGFGYVDVIDGGNLDDDFFLAEATRADSRTIHDLEALAAAHPDMIHVWQTLALARMSSVDSQNFDRKMREYVSATGGILFDVADIESHRPDGTPCLDNRDLGVEAICQDYTTERNAGHLNALGKQRLAKAMWVLMARLAGWDGVSSR